MPWSAGVYSRGYASWAADAANNLPISSSKFDTEDNDFAGGLNNCLTKDGLSAPNAAMTWGLSAAQVLALNRASDGAVFSIARAGGANSPKLTFSVADATGISGSISFGSLSLTGTGAIGTPTLALLSNGNTYLQIVGAGQTIGTSCLALVQGSSGAATINNLANSTLSFATNGVTALTIAAGGAVTIAAPSAGNTLTSIGAPGVAGFAADLVSSNSGQALRLTGRAAGQAAITVNTTANTGAGAGTLIANKPGGNTNTTTWIPVIVDGANGYIPVFG
jgi:hypothetical protein